MSNEPPFPEDPPNAPDGPAGPPPYAGPPPSPATPPPATPPPGPPPFPGPPPPYGQPHWQGHQAPLQGGLGPAYPPQAQPRTRKRWLAALVAILAVLMLAGAGFGVFVLADKSEPRGLAVEDLSSGDCLTSDGLAAGDHTITGITETDCDEDHDAEVFATFELEDDESLADAGSRCVEEAGDAGKPFEELADAGLEIRPLVAEDEPGEGDEVVCFIRHADGTQLSSPEFD